MSQLLVKFSVIFTILIINYCRAESTTPNFLSLGPNDPENIRPHRYCLVNSCTAYGVKNHVMCKYPNPGPSRNCQNPVSHPLSKDERDKIVEHHNRLRGLLPDARYFQQLKWDRELANIAQRWADQCEDGNDACRSIVVSRITRQNVAVVTETVKHAIDLPVCDFSHVFEKWVMEDGNPARPDDVSIIFNLIGCGRTVTKNEELGKVFTCRLVCNYSVRNSNDVL